MDTLLYDLSIPAISSLQGTLASQANYMQAISVIFDPKYAFLIYSPIAYLLDKQVGKKLILTTVIAEWLNMILKWIMHGERPYWYVHSSGHFDPKQVPIQQFPITCELGPGHPSGHAMVTAAVWYIILDSILKLYQTHASANNSFQPAAQTQTENQQPDTQLSHTNSRTTQAKLSIWTLYALLLVTVSVSRVFLGCHFPHQCMGGAILGLLVARWISRLDSKAMHFIGASFLLLATAFGTFGLLQAFGFDPSWTIKLATTYCVKREYIHLDTAPFFSIMRYCGFALGTGLGLMFPLKTYLAKQLVPAEGQILVAGNDKESKNPLSSKNLSWFSFKIVMALLMARLVDNLGLFVSPTYLPYYYSSAFFAYTLFSFAFVNL